MKHLALSLLLIFLAGNSIGQTAQIPNILQLRYVKKTGEIVENDKMVGYYVFYFKEKEDRKISNYEVEIFDDNYNSVKTFEITRPKNSVLMETVYNGKVFLLFFYDSKTGYEYITLDKSGKELGSVSIDKKEIPSYDIQRSMGAVQSGSENVTFFPLGTEGFVRQTYNKNKKVGYEIIAFDNEMNELWKYGSPVDSKLVESVEIGQVSEDYIGATVIRKTSLMTKRYDSFFLLLSAKTGDQVAEMEMGNDESGKKSILKNYFDEANNVILLIGEYYAPGDDVLKDKSQGLFIMEVTPEGEVTKTTEYGWKEEIEEFMSKNLSEEDQKNAKAKSYLYFHDVVRSSDGKLFLVAEQFRKQLSAGATALNVLAAASGGSSDASNFELRLGDMVVIEFDSDNKLTNYSMIKKKSTSVWLPAGAGLWNPSFIGYYVKMMGWFDYAFTSKDQDNDEYTVLYIDANRKEEKDGDKADKMLGVIQISQGVMEASRVPINADAMSWWISPAKPGNISITEYNRKEKTLEMRLEPLAY